jgi:methylisocitrate lyase
MAAVAEDVYRAIVEDGSVRRIVVTMPPRSELYEVLRYHAYEVQV